MSDMIVSANPNDILITYALGSCLGVSIYDPAARVAGLLHVMLADSAIDPVRAASVPFMFVDHAVPALFRAAYALGARKERIIAKVAGGASPHVVAGDDHFEIGRRNYLKLCELFQRNGVTVAAADVGGTVSRTMLIRVATGDVIVKTNSSERAL